MRDLHRASLAAIAGTIVLLLMAVTIAAAATVSVVVPGTANPYLAGQPDGTTCCASAGAPPDSAPAQSPVPITGIDLAPGTVLTFSAAGAVAFAPGRQPDPPDGGVFNTLDTFGLDGTPPSNGIAGMLAPQDALVGLFLDGNDPRTTAAPARLDFSSAGIGTNFPALHPALKQPFFIGDGLTGTGTGAVQQFVVPAGATRFFLGTVDGTGWASNSGTFSVQVTSSASSSGTTAAAVLPLSRSVVVNTPATAFATIIPTGPAAGVNCTITLPPGQVAATFSVNTTDPATNAITGGATAASVPAGQPQSFVISMTPTNTFNSTDVQFQFKCANGDAAQTINGVNTLTLSASSTPVPDIIALAATNPNNGIVAIPGVGASAAFAVATFNVGASAGITVSPEVRAGLPVALAVCRTDPSSGACTQGPAQAIGVQINTNETPTFAVFATATGAIPFDPANNRIFVRFRDSGGTIRGATSVAVRTP